MGYVDVGALIRERAFVRVGMCKVESCYREYQHVMLVHNDMWHRKAEAAERAYRSVLATVKDQIVAEFGYDAQDVDNHLRGFLRACCGGADAPKGMEEWMDHERYAVLAAALP